MIHLNNIIQPVTQAAYTFDAGPNAVIYALEKDVPEIIALVSKFFPAAASDDE